MFKSKEGIEIADIPTLTKQYIREKVWSHIEENNLADFPRPVTNRIPNFKMSGEAGQRIVTLDCFKQAKVIKVNPDKPQEEIRHLTLKAGKVLLVPNPRLKSGFINVLNPRELSQEGNNQQIPRYLAQTEGFRSNSRPLDLEESVQIDLVVVGSVAVSRSGLRIGKGEGFCDLEIAILSDLGCLEGQVKIITTVHDCQVFDDLPSQLFGFHDVSVDLILTPTEIIEVSRSTTPHYGLIWGLLSPAKIRHISVLSHMRDRQRRIGKDVTLAKGENVNRKGGEARQNIQVTINVNKKNRIVRRTVEQTDKQDRYGTADIEEEWREGEEEWEEKAYHLQETTPTTTTTTNTCKSTNSFSVFIGRIPSYSRVRELRETLSSKGVKPTELNWRGRYGFAFLKFAGSSQDDDTIEEVLAKLEGMKLYGSSLIVERAKDEVTKEEEKRLYEEERGRVEGQGRGRVKQPTTFSIFIGKIPPTGRVRELKCELQVREVYPADIQWRGKYGFAFLRFTNLFQESASILSALQGLTLHGTKLVVEMGRGGGGLQQEGDTGAKGSNIFQEGNMI